MAEVNLRDYVRVLVKWRRLIALNILIITGFAVILSLVLPKKYTSTAVLLPPLESSAVAGIGSLLGERSLGGLGRLAGLPGMATTSDVFAAILNSPRVLREVVRKCDLTSLYKTESLEDAIGGLRGNTRIEVSPEGMISISTTAPNPTLAAKMANTFVEKLDEFNRETAMTMGKRERIFLEERLKEVEGLLRRAENDLRDFQEEHHTVSLSEELTQAIEAAAHLKAEIVTREIQLGILRKHATEGNPQVKRLYSEISEFRRELRKIEYGDTAESAKSAPEFGAGFSVPFAELPDIALDLARRTREAKIQAEIYTLLTQQYEQAKITEVKDTPTVQLLDEARPPERRSFPQRKKIVVIAGILSLFSGVGMAFFSEYLERLRSRPDEYRDWKEILGQLVGDLKSLKSTILRR
jgi:uncharacterized protein involved in exopolysaccharide biosynthesis